MDTRFESKSESFIGICIVIVFNVLSEQKDIYSKKALCLYVLCVVAVEEAAVSSDFVIFASFLT
jgi:hypothetical protein